MNANLVNKYFRVKKNPKDVFPVFGVITNQIDDSTYIYKEVYLSMDTDILEEHPIEYLISLNTLYGASFISDIELFKKYIRELKYG